MEDSSFGVGKDDLDQDLSYVGGEYHKENHNNYRIDLYRYCYTAYIGFLANGPGAKVDKVPVANS